MNKRTIGWVVAIVLLLAVAGALVWSYTQHHAEVAAEAETASAIRNPAKVSNEGGEPVVSLDDEVQERMGVKTEPVAAMTRRKQVLAYGALEEDTAGSFILRAP